MVVKSFVHVCLDFVILCQFFVLIFGLICIAAKTSARVVQNLVEVQVGIPFVDTESDSKLKRSKHHFEEVFVVEHGGHRARKYNKAFDFIEIFDFGLIYFVLG